MGSLNGAPSPPRPRDPPPAAPACPLGVLAFPASAGVCELVTAIPAVSLVPLPRTWTLSGPQGAPLRASTLADVPNTVYVHVPVPAM